MRHWQGLSAAIMLVSAVSAQAAEKSWTVQGNGLRIATPCAKSVDIQPGGEAHQIKIAASADHGEEIDQLKVTGGDVANLDVGGARCWLQGLLYEKPTMNIVVKVPDGTALDITDGGVARYAIGAVNGALTLSFSGAGGVKAANARDLSISLSGSGASDIGEVTGRLKTRVSGAGDLTIGRLHASASDIELSGSAGVKVADGDAGVLNASLHGSGNLSLPAASAVHLTASGAGDATIKTLKGVLETRLSGSGNLTIDAIDAPSAGVQTSGHSVVKLGAGSIAAFSLSSAGASDIIIDATVTDANISMVGAGEVRIAKLTGHVNQSVTGAGRVEIANH